MWKKTMVKLVGSVYGVNKHWELLGNVTCLLHGRFLPQTKLIRDFDDFTTRTAN